MANNYKFYCCYTHKKHGESGFIKEFHADSDVLARAIASNEFNKNKNAHIGLLVKYENGKEEIACTYQHVTIEYYDAKIQTKVG